ARQGEAGEAAEVAGREHLAGDRADRGQEPRGPPHARQARPQGDATEAHRPGADQARPAAQGQGPQAEGGGGRTAPQGATATAGPRETAGAARARAGDPPQRTVHTSAPRAAAVMSGMLHAPLRVVENVRLARDTFRVRLFGPELAAAIRPGQFVML